MLSAPASGTWSDILAAARGLVTEERDPIANAANLSALLGTSLPGINWVGFYFLRGDELVLGPFQGKPACVRIALGRGVCGTAAVRRSTLVVDDVHHFPGHIACDPASNAEIVIPLVRENRVYGVLDVDSPHTARFGPDDRAGLEAVAHLYLTASDL
ncbi:MAG: GAF domain-containing protein [Pseudomonadales bacterium]